MYNKLANELNAMDMKCAMDDISDEMFMQDLPSASQDSDGENLTPEERQEAEKEIEQMESEEDDDYVTDFYTRTFRNIPILTQEEENRYATLLKTGTEEERKMAKDTLVYHNMRYVLKIAGKYVGQGNDYDDLVQSGLIGLMRAIEKYDVDMGYRVTTYATWWIKQAITRDLADNSRTIRLPVHIQDTAKRIAIAERALQVEGLSGNELVKRIAEVTGLPVEKIEHVQNSKARLVSLDMKIGGEGQNDGESVLGDFIPDEGVVNQESVIEHMDMKNELQYCMDSCLTSREKQVIQMRFGMNDDQPMTLEEIGNVLRVTRERVRQIEAKALKKLRNPKYVKNLKVFME